MYNIFLMICMFFLSAMVDASQNPAFPGLPTDNKQLLEDIKKNAQKYKEEIAAIHSLHLTKSNQEDFAPIDIGKYADKDELKNIKAMTDEWTGLVPCWGHLIKRTDLLEVVAATNPDLQIDDTGDTLLTWLCAKDSISFKSTKDKNSDPVFLSPDDKSKVLNILFNNKDTDFNKCNHESKTAFFKACAGRAIDTIHLLLNLKKSNIDINKSAREGFTPFQHVVQACQVTDKSLIIRLLSDKRLTVDYDWIFRVGNEKIKNFLLNSIIGPEMLINPFIAFVVTMKTQNIEEENKADAQKVRQETEEKLRKALEAADTKWKEILCQRLGEKDEECKRMMEQDKKHALDMQSQRDQASREKGELTVENKNLRDQHTKEVQLLRNQLTELQGALRLVNEEQGNKSQREIEKSNREKELLVKQHRNVKKIMGCLLCGSIVVNFILFYLFRR